MMAQMAVMDWVIVVLGGVMAAVLLAVLLAVVVAVLASVWSRDPDMEIDAGELDEYTQDRLERQSLEEAVPFPEAIEHEGGRVCRGCERKDGRDG